MSRSETLHHSSPSYNISFLLSPPNALRSTRIYSPFSHIFSFLPSSFRSKTISVVYGLTYAQQRPKTPDAHWPLPVTGPTSTSCSCSCPLYNVRPTTPVYVHGRWQWSRRSDVFALMTFTRLHFAIIIVYLAVEREQINKGTIEVGFVVDGLPH